MKDLELSSCRKGECTAIVSSDRQLELVPALYAESIFACPFLKGRVINWQRDGIVLDQPSPCPKRAVLTRDDDA